MTKMINIFDLLVIMAMGWALFGLVRISTDTSRSAGVALAAAVLILACLIPLLDTALRRFVFVGPAPPVIRALDRSVGYVIGPALMLYTAFLLERRPVRTWGNLLHLLPFALSIGLSAVPALHLLTIPPNIRPRPSILAPPQMGSVVSAVVQAHHLAPGLQNLGKFLSVEIYGILSLRLIRRRDFELGDCSDLSTGAELHWLRCSVLSYLLLFAAATGARAYMVVTHRGNVQTITVVNLAPLIVFSFLFVYFSRNQPIPKENLTARSGLAVAGGGPPDGAELAEAESRPPESMERPKYERSRLAEVESEAMFRELTVFVESKKIYLDPSISLADLAEKMGVSRHHLSQVINTKSSGNFYTFINQFRVDEFVKLIKQGEHKSKTLVALALDCGFNSYATFYNTFKRINGSTPRAFIGGRGVEQPA